MIDEQIRDGDFVIVEDRRTADNGEMVIALLNGSDVTLKKMYREQGRIRLQPANPDDAADLRAAGPSPGARAWSCGGSQTILGHERTQTDQLHDRSRRSRQTSQRTYANFCAISHTPFDFTLAFCEVLPLSDKDIQAAEADHVVQAPVRAKIVVPLQVVPNLIAALQEHMRVFSESTGATGTKDRSTELASLASRLGLRTRLGLGIRVSNPSPDPSPNPEPEPRTPSCEPRA